jgi:hypothetical protein
MGSTDFTPQNSHSTLSSFSGLDQDLQQLVRLVYINAQRAFGAVNAQKEGVGVACGPSRSVNHVKRTVAKLHGNERGIVGI